MILPVGSTIRTTADSGGDHNYNDHNYNDHNYNDHNYNDHNYNDHNYNELTVVPSSFNVIS